MTRPAAQKTEAQNPGRNPGQEPAFWKVIVLASVASALLWWGIVELLEIIP